MTVCVYQRRSDKFSLGGGVVGPKMLANWAW